MKGTSSAHDSNRAKEKAAETDSPPRRITRELYQHHLRSRGGREEGCERKIKGRKEEGAKEAGGSEGGWRADRLLDLVVKWQLSVCAHQQMHI